MKCGNCQTEELDIKHRRCPNCGATNPGFVGNVANPDIEKLKTENEDLKKRIEKLENEKQKGPGSVL